MIWIPPLSSFGAPPAASASCWSMRTTFRITCGARALRARAEAEAAVAAAKMAAAARAAADAAVALTVTTLALIT